MEIKTKFDINQFVYAVQYSTEEIVETCPVCNGTGKVKLDNDKEYTCPECYGNGCFSHYSPKEYRITLCSKVGEIRIECNEKKYEECCCPF